MNRKSVINMMNQQQYRFLGAYPVDKRAVVVYKDKDGKEIRRIAAHTELNGWFFETSPEAGRQLEVMSANLALEVDKALSRLEE